MLRLFLFSKKKIDLDVDKVEADTYFRTTDGVLHLNEVKNTPNAFVEKLRKTADGGQFARYSEWIEKGTKLNPPQAREVTVYVKNTQPNFHYIIDSQTLEALKKSIAQHDSTATILEMGGKKFSFDELQKLTKDAYKALKKIKKKNPNMEFTEIADEYFDSMENAFKTLGKEYGH